MQEWQRKYNDSLARWCPGDADKLVMLRDRIEELEELLGVGEETTVPLRAVFGFTLIEGEIAGLLMARQLVSLESFSVVVYGHLPVADRPSSSDRTIQVHLCRVRRKFAKKRVKVETVFREGWLISPRDKDKVRRLIGRYSARQQGEQGLEGKSMRKIEALQIIEGQINTQQGSRLSSWIWLRAVVAAIPDALWEELVLQSLEVMASGK